MPLPRKLGDKRAANWNLSSKNSRKIITSLEISRSSIWVSVTKPPRWLCRSGPWPRIRSRKTPRLVLGRLRSSPGWRRRWESPTAPSPLYRNYSRSRTRALSLRARSLLRCSGSIQCSIRSGMIRASKNSSLRPRRSNIWGAQTVLSPLTPICSRTGARALLGCKGVNAQDASAEPKPDLPLEIAHVLLIDVVGYSKLLVNEQIEFLQELNQIVRNTECFRSAETKGKLIRVSTGDGMALLFFHSPEEPVRCALEISRTLQEHPHIQLRMGVHSGPVNQVTDVNDKT